MYTPHRAVRRTVTAAAALGLTVAGVSTATGAVAATVTDTVSESAAGVSATASRTTELAASGDEVTVTARGFTPNASVSVGLYGDKTLDKDGARTLVADGNGFVATPLVVGTAFASDAKVYEIRVAAKDGRDARVAITFAADTGAQALVSAESRGGVEAASAPMAAPMATGSGVSLTVSPSTGVDPAGASLTVKGAGYVAGSGTGIYVVFGPKAADWTTNAGNYGASKWLKAVPDGQSESINADGTFSVTLAGVKAKYKDGNGKDVDCLKTPCYVLTMAAHGSPDRSQDASAAIAFKGGSTTTGGGSATDDATTGGSTTAGSTTAGSTTGGSTAEGSTTGSTTSGGSGDTGTSTTTDSGKSDGGSLPLTGAAGIATAATVGSALVAAGAIAVLTTRRRRGNSPSTNA